MSRDILSVKLLVYRTSPLKLDAPTSLFFLFTIFIGMFASACFDSIIRECPRNERARMNVRKYVRRGVNAYSKKGRAMSRNSLPFLLVIDISIAAK